MRASIQRKTVSVPTLLYAHHLVRFRRGAEIPEPRLRALIEEHGFSLANLSYRLTSEGRHFEYRMVIRTRDAGNAVRLARTWSASEQVIEFRIAPTGD